MRASRRSGGGASSGRDLSPPPHSSSSRGRDHSQRSEWRHYSSRSRHSLSPSARDQSGRRTRKRSSSPGRRSDGVSVERAEYDEAPTLSSRRHDHGKQQRDRSPHPLPSQSRGGGGGRVALTLDSSLAGDDCYDGFHRKYLQTDSPPDMHMDGNPNKLARVVKVREFHHPQVVNSGAALTSSSGAVIDDQGMLVHKSVYLDDGSVRTFFPLPPEQAAYPAEAAALNNPSSVGAATGGGTLRIGVRGADELRYHHERLKAATYDEEEKQRIYSRDAPYPLVFPSQRRPIGDTSSSGAPRDEFLVSYPSDSFGRSNSLSGFRSGILGHDEYGQLHVFDTAKQRALSPPVRDEPRSHGYVELGRRERDDYRFAGSDEPHKKMKWISRAEYREILGSGFPDPPGERIDDVEASPRIMRDSRLWEPQHCLEGGTISEYQDTKRVHEEYRRGGSGSVSLTYGTKSARDGEFVLPGRSYHYGRDTDLVSYRERSRSPPVADRHTEIFRRNLSPRGRIDAEDLDIYDPPFERVVERNYITEEEISILRETRNARAIELSEEDERQADERRMEMMPSRRSGYDRNRHKMLPRRISESGAWLPSDDSFVHSEGGRVVNLKRRPKPSSYGSYSVDRRQDFHRPYRFWKKGYEDHRTMNELDRDVLEDEAPLLKADPPEDSEEFKQQVHKSFLRFTKILNEDPHQQKRFRDPAKAQGLLCCVCGSQSKEFMDTHSLVTHAFHSLKIGLKTEHLGLHKALCVLVGWNWDVPPDNSRNYQMSPVPEFKALKEDLIIWPPVVIVHISIGNENVTNEPKDATNGSLEEVLKVMKFEAGKVKVCRGKSSNQSILLVKFMPTFSGLQEADRLHKYYINKKHGRKEFEEAISKESSVKEVESEVQVEQLVYGYMGTMEDFDKLDPETKKRCVVKSRKDIESIADAPLRGE